MNGRRNEKIYSDPDLVTFYDLENGDAAEGGRADFDFCRMLAQQARSVLDLGCGTGELTVSLAPGRRVAGADPAPQMLEIARNRPGGQDVTWIESSAEDLDLDATFDLIVMTGHAFQTLLTDQQVVAVLRTIRQHLSPDGQFIFDSRNPAFGLFNDWVPEKTKRSGRHPTFGPFEAWEDMDYDAETGIVTYQTFYKPEGHAPMRSEAQIRFIDQPHLARLLDAAGLTVTRWIGDWQGTPYQPGSREIIPLGRLA